jgi:hypothetical protein
VTPTARSLDLLRRDGWTAECVEKFLPYGRVRRDYLGFIDVLAIQLGERILAVQATSASNVSARVKKALESPHLRTWLSTGARFEVWGWSKKGAAGKRKTWQLTRRVLTLTDAPAPPDAGPTQAERDAGAVELGQRHAVVNDQAEAMPRRTPGVYLIEALADGVAFARRELRVIAAPAVIRPELLTPSAS